MNSEYKHCWRSDYNYEHWHNIVAQPLHHKWNSSNLLYIYDTEFINYQMVKKVQYKDWFIESSCIGCLIIFFGLGEWENRKS